MRSRVRGTQHTTWHASAPEKTAAVAILLLLIQHTCSPFSCTNRITVLLAIVLCPLKTVFQSVLQIKVSM